MTLFELRLIESVLRGEGSKTDYDKALNLIKRDIEIKVLDPRKGLGCITGDTEVRKGKI